MVKCTLIDIGTGKATTTFPGATAAELAAVETFLDTYSAMGLLSAVEITPLSVTATTPDPGSNVDRQLRIPYKAVETGKSGRLSIPAPLATGTIGRHGERLDPALAQVIIDDWVHKNGLSGTLVAKRGVFIQKV